MQNGVTLVRFATHIVATFGVSKVVKDIIFNNTNVVTTADGIKVLAGSLVLGSMVAEHAANHVDRQFNMVYEWYQRREADDNGAT
jgi:hypothetical protein